MPEVNVFAISGTDTLNGFFKRLYAEKLLNRVPMSLKLQQDVGFDGSHTPGEDFQQTVELQLEHGVSYAASTEDAFDLVLSERSATQPARIAGSQLLLKTQIGYKAAFAGQRGEQAFANTTRSRVRNMWMSMHKRLEIDLFYGQSDETLGEDSAAAAGQATITAGSWASGIWNGMTGAWLDVWDAKGAAPGDVPTTLLAGSPVQIETVNPVTRVITWSETIAGGAPRFFTLAKPSGSPVGSQGQVAGGAFKTMVGLDVITRKSAGTLFNITSTADTWQGTAIDAGAVDLSFGIWNDAVATAVGKGADGDYVGYISPLTWGNLLTDQGALRRYDSSQNSRSYQIGAKDIEFFSQNGKLTIKSHPMVKQGKAYAIMPETFKRIGATDITWDRASMPGVSGAAGSFFRELETKAGFELRAYTDQALFTDAPSWAICIFNITNS